MPGAQTVWIGGRADGGPASEALTSAGVRLTGWLTREEAVAELARATALLHFSAWDGQSMTVLEALARDVVVVASDIPPNRELVGTGQLAATEAEAGALLRAMLTDPARRGAALADQRRRRACFGAGRMVAEWLALYERVLVAAPAHRLRG